MFRLATLISLVLWTVSTANAGSISTKLDVTFYGFIQADVIYSEHDPADIIDFFANNMPSDSRADLNFSAQNTRLGFDIKVPTEHGWTVAGKLEGDFSNTPNTSNATPRLRHAYVSADRSSWGLLAGQTWMVIAPQNPSMLNAGILGYAGNIWPRYPQVRVTGRQDDFKLELAALKMTNDNNTALAHTLTEEPRYQARISWNGDLPFAPRAVFGLWGDIGKHGLNTGRTEVAARSHVTGLDMVLPLGRVTLTGELFQAQNAALLLASGGVAPANGDAEIRSIGGFVNAGITVTDRLKLNLGYGAERNEREQLALGSVQRNRVAYANLGYKLTSAVSVLGEYVNHATEYNAVGRRENNRCQFSVKYDF